MSNPQVINRLMALSALNEHIKLPLLDSYIHLLDYQFDSLLHRTVRTGLFFLLKGEVELLCQGQILTLKAGDMMFYPINLLLQGTISPAQSPILFISITVNVDLLLKLCNKLALKPQKNPLPPLPYCKMSSTIEEALYRIYALLDELHKQSVLLDGRETELYYHLLESPLGASLQEVIKPDSALNKVGIATQFIAENLHKKIAVKDIANLVGMSNASLYQHFKQLTQLTPIQYQKILRLNEARHLLSINQLSISQIAFKIGYESPNQFSREYKRLFGVTPRQEKSSLIKGSAQNSEKIGR